MNMMSRKTSRSESTYHNVLMRMTEVILTMSFLSEFQRTNRCAIPAWERPRRSLSPAQVPCSASASMLAKAGRQAIKVPFGSMPPAPVPIPKVWESATPLDSWHILEQSGILLVPKARVNTPYRKAASLLDLPEV